MLRQPIRTSTSGTSQPTFPTEPATTVRVGSITAPGSCHQTAAAATTASPMTNNPTPSRRCSGSRSRALRPMDRATDPMAWASPSHTAATPRPNAANARKTGPGPLRTARGAARRVRVGARLLEDRFFLRPVLFAVLRVRVLEPPRPDRPLLDRPEADVLVLRDPGGEDVRVAMAPNVGHRHSRHMHHKLVSGLRSRCPRVFAGGAGPHPPW